MKSPNGPNMFQAEGTKFNSITQLYIQRDSRWKHNEKIFIKSVRRK